MRPINSKKKISNLITSPTNIKLKQSINCKSTIEFNSIRFILSNHFSLLLSLSFLPFRNRFDPFQIHFDFVENKLIPSTNLWDDIFGQMNDYFVFIIWMLRLIEWLIRHFNFCFQIFNQILIMLMNVYAENLTFIDLLSLKCIDICSKSGRDHLWTWF